MPYSDPEKQKEYNLEYNRRNKEKVNERNRQSRKRTNRTEKDRERYTNDPEYKAKVQAKNKEQYQKHKAKRTETQKLRRRARRQELVEYLGGSCVGCGATESLQFDHLDRQDKSFCIGKALDYSMDRLKAEADKCQLLCYTCHEYKSLINHDKDKLAEGYRVVSVDTIGDEVIIRLRR